MDKICKRCKIQKPSDSFYTDIRASDGLYSWCSECCVEGSREYRINNRVKYLTSQKSYREDNRQILRERAKQWRLNNPNYSKARTSRKISIVYVWMNPDGQADYVGRGTKERAQSHKKKSWYTPQHTLLTMTCDNEWQAMEYEGIWGARYQPRYNIEGYRHA